MASKTLNTRIRLRVDTAANWAAHDTQEKGGVKIYKGEAALSLQTGDNAGKYEIRYGISDDGSYWSELTSGNFLVKAANVEGLLDSLYDYQLIEDKSAGTIKLQKKLQSESSWSDVSTITLVFAGGKTYSSTNGIALQDYVDEKVAAATTQYFEAVRGTVTEGEETRPQTDTEVITQYFTEHTGITVKGGSTFVIKTLITGTSKYEYIAFTYDTTTDSENPVWRAMDGNYTADSVYFTEDITLAGSYTSVGNVKLSDGTITAAGKSVKDVFDTIFDKTVQPTLGTAPSTTFALSNAGAKEIGTTITPTWSTVTFNAGKYNTPWNSSTVSDGTTKATNSVKDNAGHTSTENSGSFDSITITGVSSFKCGSTSYNSTYQAQAQNTYNAGTIAKDNKGNNSNPVIQRAAGTTSWTNASTISGFRYGQYWGTSATAIASSAVTSTMIRNNLTKGNTSTSGSGARTWTVDYTSSSAFSTLIVVVLGNRTLNGAFNNSVFAEMKDGFNANRTTVQVQGADGTDTYATTYTVWTYTPSDPYAANAHVNITFTIA